MQVAYCMYILTKYRNLSNKKGLLIMNKVAAAFAINLIGLNSPFNIVKNANSTSSNTVDLKACMKEYYNLDTDSLNSDMVLNLGVYYSHSEDKLFTYFYQPSIDDSIFDKVSLSTSLVENESKDGYVDNFVDYQISNYYVQDLNNYKLSAYTFDEKSLFKVNKFNRFNIKSFSGKQASNGYKSKQYANLPYFSETMIDDINHRLFERFNNAVVITDKISAYYLTNLSDNEQSIYRHVLQDCYIGFNTNLELNNICKVEINYDQAVLKGETNITTNSKDSWSFMNNFDPYNLDNLLTQFKGADSLIDKSNISYENKTEMVESEQQTVYSDPHKSWWFIPYRNRFIYDTIFKPSETENVSEELKKYQWCVRFAQTTMTVNSVHHEGISFGFLPKDVEVNYYIENAYDIKNSVIFRLWNQEESGVKEYKVLDVHPIDPDGVDVVNPTKEINPIDEFFQKLSDFFQKNGKWFLIGLVVIAALILISLVFKGINILKGIYYIFKYLFIGIWYVISSPVRLIKYLFDRKS